MDSEIDLKDAENLISTELLKLSVSDRNANTEEIHGVRCLAPEETPELLERSLFELAQELDAGDLLTRETHAYRKIREIPHSYVNTRDFRLRFLRCELFDAKKAARRMALFLETALDVFGEYALLRPVRLSDFGKHEVKYLRRGRYQFLPFRDQSGRRIFAFFPGEEIESIPARIKAKICIYKLWTAGNDVDTQRRGLCVLVWFDKTANASLRPREVLNPRFEDLSTIRPSVIHICTPDTTFHRFRRAMATMRITNRVKLQFHIGNHVELTYILQGYGIPVDTIPITYSGTVKTQWTRQWIRMRAFLEEPIYQDSKAIQSIIECPYTSDIVIRQGTSILSHPGNNAFRALIADKFENYRKIYMDKQARINQKVSSIDNSPSYNNKSQQTMDVKYDAKAIVEEILEEIQRQKLRILVWNDSLESWNILEDPSQIYLKIDYQVRDYKSSLKALARRQKNHSNTSMFVAGKGKRRGSNKFANLGGKEGGGDDCCSFCSANSNTS